MKRDKERFVQFANPSAWLRSAEDLKDQAQAIYRKRGRVLVHELDGDGETVHILDGADRSCFLLCGFSLENLIKGLKIYDEPSLIQDGKLHKELRSHDLLRLIEKMGPEYRSHETASTLMLFSDAIVAWARYPCALDASKTNYPFEFSASVWDRFERLYEMLRTSLRSKLEHGWSESSGFFGRWVFEEPN